MKALTKRQQEVLCFIQQQLAANALPPTRAEIASALGFRSVNAAEDHLKALAKKKVIEIIAGTSRGIRLLDVNDSRTDAFECNEVDEASSYEQVDCDHELGKSALSQGLPLIGQVAAGTPILAQEQIERYCAISGVVFHPHADFLLTVKGDSMINIGLFDGDLLAVHKTSVVNNGQVAVVRIDDEVTVKRFERQGKFVYLHAENDDYPPIVVDLSLTEITVEGLAVGVIRASF